MKVNQVALKLESIALDSKVRVLNVQTSFEYENGTCTDKQNGVKYGCVAEKNDFEKFSVTTTESVPVITNEQIAESSEPVYITFSPDFVGKFYFSNRTNSWELSCKSTKAMLIKSQPKAQ